MFLCRNVDTRNLYDRAYCEKQPAPYEDVLEYERQVNRSQNLVPDTIYGIPTEDSVRNAEVSTTVYAYYDSVGLRAQAGERLYAKIRAGTGTAETMAELSGDLHNIHVKTGQLMKSYRLLRRGKIGKAFRALGLNTPSAALRGAADATLTWEFGIKPTISSISDSVDFLQQNPYVRKVNSGSRDKILVDQKTKARHGSGFTTGTQETKVFCGAHVRLTNPNLALADSYGFFNPVKLGWELIPASFLVDYFIPVGKFLGAFSPLYGREISFPYTSVIVTRDVIETVFDTYSGELREQNAFQGVYFRRLRGIRETYSPTDVVSLSLPPIGAAKTTVALAIKAFLK